MPFKIATWNVNSLKVRLPQVLAWLDEARPDVLALQETKLTDDRFPVAEINQAGYQVRFAGQKTYNGVATLSRSSIKTIADSLPEFDDPQRRVLATNHSGLLILNLYIPNGAEVGSDKYHYKLAWLAKLLPFIQHLQTAYERLIILGDFNIAPADDDVYDPEKWRGSVLVSEPERNAFKTLLTHGLVDCFRLFEQPEKSYSWWDYRAAAYRRNHGIRIDHILASTALAEVCQTCHIDKAPRAFERPSDHTPVIATFDLA